jgi:alcohol dehydrogenase YqhD (iron-dependent ADH family)
MVTKFSFAATPHIHFGSGKIKLLPNIIEGFGSKVLLITGKKSFIQSDHWDQLLLQFESAKIHWSHYVIDKEPTPSIIDECVDAHRM